MKNTQIEASKSFHHGFVLNEQELRRIIEITEDQLKKIDSEKEIIHQITVTFSNGATGEMNNIEELLEIENIGSSKIIRFAIVIYLKDLKDKYNVKLMFINVDEEDYFGNISILYRIESPSRDWAFVTSSLLEERINKIKRWAANSIGEGSGKRNPFRKLIILLMVMSIPFSVFVIPEFFKPEKENSALKKLIEYEEKAKGNDSLNIVSIYLDIEKNKLIKKEDDKKIQPVAVKRASILILIMILLALVGKFIVRYYPVYNFCWGDYKEVFEKKESVRKTVLIVVIAGIVISTIGGIIANLTGFGA